MKVVERVIGSGKPAFSLPAGTPDQRGLPWYPKHFHIVLRTLEENTIMDRIA
jgi:hypothetical protein